MRLTIIAVLILFLVQLACNPDGPVADKMQLVSVRVGQTALNAGKTTVVEADQSIVVTFSKAIDPESVDVIKLTKDSDKTDVSLTVSFADLNKQLVLETGEVLQEGETYVLDIPNTIRGEDGAPFDGISFTFEIEKLPLELVRLFVENTDLDPSNLNAEIPLNPEFTVVFNQGIPLSALESNVVLNGNSTYVLSIQQLTDSSFILQPETGLHDYEKLNLFFSSSIGEAIDRDFDYVRFELFTQLDSTPDFPLVSDEQLLTIIQQQTFKYFWDFGHPNSGMARERNTSGNTVTAGGSGFGIMSLIVGVERGFISRSDAVERWTKIIAFLESADRFHGAWSHWINGNTGEVIPFSQKDDGGDLVETAFLVQGLLTVRQYLDIDDPEEKDLIDRINVLWQAVEWDWYSQGGQKQLYWHWSPNYGWDMNMVIRGHDETQIVYILAAASDTHGIDRETYENGYARNGDILNGNTYYGIELPLGYAMGGPLFFAHYSYLGLDPRNLSDQYADYWNQNRAHTLINRAYCIDNPGNYIGYSSDCWGLTASDNESGYSAHSPTNDKGVITPTAAISSIPYTPEESMEAIRHFYYRLGDRLWGEYGFFDAFNFTEGWVASSYIAIDQGPIILMIENYRTGLLWDLFMSAPEIQAGLTELGFSY